MLWVACRADHAAMSDLSINAASAIQQSQIKNQVDVAVAKKSLDVQKQAGEAAVALIQAAADTAKANAPRAGQGSVGGGRADIYG